MIFGCAIFGLMVSCGLFGASIIGIGVGVVLMFEQWDKQVVIEGLVDEDPVLLLLHKALGGSLVGMSVFLGMIYRPTGSIPLLTGVPALVGLIVLYAGRWSARYSWYLRSMGSHELSEKFCDLCAHSPSSQQPKAAERKLNLIQRELVERNLIP